MAMLDCSRRDSVGESGAWILGARMSSPSLILVLVAAKFQARIRKYFPVAVMNLDLLPLFLSLGTFVMCGGRSE
ncbi:unnamed protein product [Cuscuta campestris]|uniref:Uncharacterized protein n=1 Tax=Cuscuta campestris TaxID=132261 RepID=A0A484K538_9ASTE|nr:unnamed protein product [Cuscuta campestris]